MTYSPRNSTHPFIDNFSDPLLYATPLQISEFQNTGRVPCNYDPFDFMDLMKECGIFPPDDNSDDDESYDVFA